MRNILIHVMDGLNGDPSAYAIHHAPELTVKEAVSALQDTIAIIRQGANIEARKGGKTAKKIGYRKARNYKNDLPVKDAIKNMAAEADNVKKL